MQPRGKDEGEENQYEEINRKSEKRRRKSEHSGHYVVKITTPAGEKNDGKVSSVMKILKTAE